jgi:hypothetical protein
MRRLARSGGFCAHHARRAQAIGLSATVALVYLSLIEDCLPLLAAGRDRRTRGAALLPAADACEACAQAAEVERRECFFLALLIGARGPSCYGAPAIVCMRHLRRLIEYLDDRDIREVLAIHRETAVGAAAAPSDAADRAVRILLGPQTGRTPPVAAGAGRSGGRSSDPDPVHRLRSRLADLPSCAVCAEIADACAEWLGWLARMAEGGGDLSDVLPLCREHVWQARDAAGPALAPALAAIVRHEAGERLFYAGAAASRHRGAGALRRAVRRIAGAPQRGAVLAALEGGRECPLCRRVGEAGERALGLLAALLESADGRRAFESGYGLCVQHAAQAMAIPGAPALGQIVARVTRARLLLLRWELEEQLRRGAWQARPERRGAESGAWLRAGARFAGSV